MSVGGSKPLHTSALTDEEIIGQIKNGKGAMPPFQGRISDEEIQALLEKDTLTEKEKETLRATQRKNRDDHRHHLLDAVVIAFTTQGHIQKLNNLNKL